MDFEEFFLLNELANSVINNTDKGKLIVFEGVDASGKSTQMEKTTKWLKKEGYDVVTTSWNSSKIVKKATKKAKKERQLTPLLYSLLHAADMVHRYEYEILPALQQNKVVIADRYVYTSLVRDKARGVDLDILKKVYAGFREPDILFHCSVPIDVALSRLKKKGLTYYGTGSDLNLADNRADNYVKYEEILNKNYNEILPKVKNYYRLDMDRPIDTIFTDVKKEVKNEFNRG